MLYVAHLSCEMEMEIEIEETKMRMKSDSTKEMCRAQM